MALLSREDEGNLGAALEQGRPRAASEMLPAVYKELRALAARMMAQEAPGQTLQPTALVHEAYVRLAGAEDAPRWHNHRHFCAAAAEAMRRILIEVARRKRGRESRVRRTHEDRLGEVAAPADPTEDLLALDEALTQFAAADPRRAELVKLRFYAGLTAEEAAHCLGISRATADRHWAYARAWLYNRLEGRRGDPGAGSSGRAEGRPARAIREEVEPSGHGAVP
ncbi:MAG TPA: ECF-type sigma factor [Isosphaeraceae bacterium]